MVIGTSMIGPWIDRSKGHPITMETIRKWKYQVTAKLHQNSPAEPFMRRTTESPKHEIVGCVPSHHPIIVTACDRTASVGNCRTCIAFKT